MRKLLIAAAFSLAFGGVAVASDYIVVNSSDPAFKRGQAFDAGARVALGAAKDEDFAQMWSLKMGDRVLSTQPRGEVVRQTINHLVHHRGQLSVYLRLLDVPVPSIYGPTADEGWGG